MDRMHKDFHIIQELSDKVREIANEVIEEPDRSGWNAINTDTKDDLVEEMTNEIEDLLISAFNKGEARGNQAKMSKL